MSEQFEDKNYEDYFYKLDEIIKKQPEVRPVDIKPAVNTKRKGSARKKKLLKRNAFVFACALISLALICGTVKMITAVSAKKDSPADTPQSNVNYDKKSAVENPKTYAAKTTGDTVTFGEEVACKNAVIIDLQNDVVIAEKHSHEKAYPASLTKIMTLLTAIDEITDYNDTFQMTLAITDPLFVQNATVAGFLDGEQVNMTDMLYGVILPSGADAAIGLSLKLAGSEEAFVKLMNKKVKSLGLKNTSFSNVSGLFDENNYTTAYDMAVILKTAMENELCKKILSTYQYTSAKTPQNPNGIPFSSTLFSYMYGTEPEGAAITGGKTGFVNESGYCIASFGQNDTTGNEYIVVTLGSPGRWPAFYGQIDLYSRYVK